MGGKNGGRVTSKANSNPGEGRGAVSAKRKKRGAQPGKETGAKRRSGRSGGEERREAAQATGGKETASLAEDSITRPRMDSPKFKKNPASSSGKRGMRDPADRRDAYSISEEGDELFAKTKVEKRISSGKNGRGGGGGGKNLKGMLSTQTFRTRNRRRYRTNKDIHEWAKDKWRNGC